MYSMHHPGKVTIPGKAEMYHYSKHLYSFILRLQTMTPKYYISSYLNLLNQYALCSIGWLLHLLNLQSTKYRYQRSQINSCSEGYSLTLLHFLQWHFFKKKKKTNLHKTQTHSHCDDPVITLPQSNCSSSREGAVDQCVGLAQWVGTWEDRSFWR